MPEPSRRSRVRCRHRDQSHIAAGQECPRSGAGVFTPISFGDERIRLQWKVSQGGVTMFTAADCLVETLLDWGVEVVFGLPGDGINGIMESLRARQDKIRFIQVRHEESAAFMACGYAKYTGKIGVCLATSGPGGLHLINGLYDAKLDGQPVVAITGMQATSQLGTGFQQEVHLERIFADLCVYNEMFQAPATIPAVVDIAVRSAVSMRGVAHL